MKLAAVQIQNYRAIDELSLPLHPSLTVLHGNNAHGKTSVLSVIAVGLGAIPRLLPGVAGIGFLQTDLRRHAKRMRVALKATDGTEWNRQRTIGGEGERRATTRIRDLRDRMNEIIRAEDEERAVPLPIVAYYDTERAVFDTLPWRRDFGKGSSRFSALDGALSTRANFRAFAEWFYAWENEELREQKRRRNFDYRLKELEVVRRAIASMVPGASEPHVEHRPRRLVVSLELDSGEPETLALNQLSGGHRIVLAVAGDLARRMAHGNPHLEDPLSSEAIVLIDEVELHLHPEWQQRVLPDLTRTFPNTQFIVTTHSAQVLTAVRPEQIVELARDDDRVVAGSAPAPTYGAEAGDVLFTVMRVDERPPGNEFTKALNRYMRLIEDGKGESGQANAACTAMGVPVAQVRDTIRLLGLNVRRLQQARRRRWNGRRRTSAGVDMTRPVSGASSIASVTHTRVDPPTRRRPRAPNTAAHANTPPAARRSQCAVCGHGEGGSPTAGCCRASWAGCGRACRRGCAGRR